VFVTDATPHIAGDGKVYIDTFFSKLNLLSITNHILILPICPSASFSCEVIERNAFVAIGTFLKEAGSIEIISHCYLWRIKFEMVTIATKHENETEYEKDNLSESSIIAITNNNNNNNNNKRYSNTAEI